MAAITYLTTGLELGGAEMQLTALACGFAKRGWRVQVVSMLPVGGMVLADRLRQCGVEVVSLELNPKLPNPMAIGRLAAVVRDFRSDILHSHMVKANILGRLARKPARVKAQISTAHNLIEGGRWVDWAYRLTDRFADVTTNVSERAVDRYVDIGAVPSRDRIRLVRNGLDLSPFKKDRELRAAYRHKLEVGSDFVWLAVGRLTPQKDYLNMLGGFQKVVTSRQDSRLLIVGKGESEGEIRDAAERLLIADRVSLLGERDDVPRLMNAADAYVMSSLWEGAPMVLLEAGASSLPVVATDVGGNGELVDDGRSGILVPPEDPAALGDAMLRIMHLPLEERSAMGSAGRERTEREFSMERILDQWEGLYDELST